MKELIYPDFDVMGIDSPSRILIEAHCFIDGINPDNQNFADFLNTNIDKCFAKGRQINKTFKYEDRKLKLSFTKRNPYTILLFDGTSRRWTFIEKRPEHEVVSAIILYPTKFFGLQSREDIFMIKRPDDDPIWPGMWYFPTEHIEEGRPTWRKGVVQTAIHRGIREETGIEVEIKGLLKPYNIFYNGERFRVWPSFCEAYMDDHNTNEEVADHDWIPLNKICEKLGRDNFIEGKRSEDHDIEDVIEEIFPSLFPYKDHFSKFHNRPCPLLISKNLYSSYGK